MRYPYSLFIRFLLTRRADINGTLRSFGLPELSVEERTEHDVSSSALPKSVEEYYHSSTRKVENKEGFLEWAEVHDVREMWEIQPEFADDTKRLKLTSGNKDMQNACQLFSDPKRRTALSVLLIKKFSDEDIIDIFSKKFYLSIGSGALEIARKYFFDFSRLRNSDWSHLLKNLSTEQRSSLQVGIEPHTKEFIRYSVGSMPEVSFDSIMQDIMISAYYKFKECLNRPYMDDMARDWADMAMKAGISKAKYGRGDRVGLKDELQMRFIFTEDNFPTLTELSTTEHPITSDK